MMKNFNAPENQSKRDILVIGLAAVLGLASIFAQLQPAHADTITPPPPVPTDLQPPARSKLFRVGHAQGTQNYICLPASTGFAFSLFTPEATLFDDKREQIITHFFSPDPSPDPAENGMIRATWVDSRDTSTVWAAVAPKGSTTDPKFVESGAIAWLKLNVLNGQDGPNGGDRLTKTTVIQRLNTHGGLAPATGCASLTDVGTKAFVPYRADYFFYK